MVPLFVEQICAGEADHDYRSDDDAIRDVAGRSRRSCPPRFRERTERRYVRPEGARCHGRRLLAESVLRYHGKARTIRSRVIGTRHGEKLYETLLSREEMAIADDQGDYFRVPPDNRDLNYSIFVEKGDKEISQA